MDQQRRRGRPGTETVNIRKNAGDIGGPGTTINYSTRVLNIVKTRIMNRPGKWKISFLLSGTTERDHIPVALIETRGSLERNKRPSACVALQ